MAEEVSLLSGFMRYMNILDPVYCYVSAKQKTKTKANNEVGLNNKATKGSTEFTYHMLRHTTLPFPTVV